MKPEYVNTFGLRKVSDKQGEILEITLDASYKYMENTVTVTTNGLENIATPNTEQVASMVMNRQSAISLRNLLIQTLDGEKLKNGPPRRSHFLLVFCGGEQLFAPAQKQGQGRRTGQSIRNGLRGVDSHDAACHPGQNNSQGNQQDHFTQQGQEQTGTGLAQSHKGSLAGQLSAKGPDTAKEDWHNPAYQVNEFLLRGKIRASIPGNRATTTKETQVTVKVTVSSRLKVWRTRR